MKCFSCGIEKDPAKLEQSPYCEEDGLADDPMSPLCVMECQSDTDHTIFKAVVVCLECFHKLEPDMWISEGMWQILNPRVSFDKLPKISGTGTDQWNPENYKEEDQK
jgi:hypothetical protein